LATERGRSDGHPRWWPFPHPQSVSRQGDRPEESGPHGSYCVGQEHLLPYRKTDAPNTSSSAAGLVGEAATCRATSGHNLVMQGNIRSPSHADLVADLRIVREKGLGQLRRYQTPALTLACELRGYATDEANRPASVEALIKQAVLKVGGGKSGEAAEYTFGVVTGTRLWNPADRRKSAASTIGVSVERFRKGYEPHLIEQVAEGVLSLLHDQVHVQVAEDAEFPEPAASEAEILLARKLHQAGVVEFCLSRADYHHTLAQFMEQARASIVMVAMSLKSKGAENEVIEVFRKSLGKWPQFRIIVSLLNPDSPACHVGSLVLGVSQQLLYAEIEAMSADLIELKNSLNEHEANRLYLLRHNVLPGFSGILLDDGLPTAQLQIEAKLYAAPRSDSYGFTLKPTGELYERQRRAYYRILQDADPFPADANRPVLPIDLNN
jgi:hypothetical protein